MAIRPVRGEDGAVCGYISVASDITEMVALRRRLMAIFENVPACIVLFDEEGVIIDCNREVETLTRLPKSLVVGLRCSDYSWAVFNDTGPPYATQEHPVYVALREDRQVEGVVIGFMRGRVAADDPNGELRWLKGNINPVKLDGGRRIAIFSFSDISDEIATQALLRGALAETQKTLAELSSYKAALDQHSLLTVVDRDRRLTFVNDMFCAVSGYSREEALGKTLAQLLDSGEHPIEFYRHLDRTIRAGKTWRSQICNRAKDGQLFWLDETVVPQTNATGEIVAHISMSFNVTERVLAERQRSESEARYKLLADNSSDVIILGHNDGRRTYYSPAIRRLTGHTPEEAVTVTMREWVHPDDLQGVYRATAGLSEAQPTTTIVHRLRRKDGTYIWVEGAFSRVMTASGEPCIVANIRDVTGRKVIEEEYRNLYAHAIVGIYRKTLDGRLTRANPALVALRGYGSEAELMAAYNAGHANWYVDPGRRAERQERLLRDGLVTDFVSQVTVPNRKEPLWISETAWLMRDDAGQPSYIEGMVADVTERMTSQAALEKLARNDVLTDLPNRMALCEAVEEALAQGKGGDRSLIYVDLDRFKAVNDSHGHAAGDEVVREVARRLAAITGEGDLLARLGGDEFALLVRETASLTRAEQLAIQIIAAVNRPISLACGQFANVGASIGIALVQIGEASAESVIRRADLAMYQAKRDGRNAFRRYTKALDDQVALRQTIDLGLRIAIEKQQFELHFQPVFEASTVAHAGFEALIRWRHPEHGLMSPAHFVPIAEETGMIVPIGEWVLDEALRQAAIWPEHCRIAINASVVQLRRPEFASVVMAALARHNVAPGRLEIEVTESVLLDDSPATLAVLQKLQVLGVHVALDDFGTGWSSLSYLNRHRFDRIKIDRSFVNGMNDMRNEAIIRSIVDLGDRLGIQITAEGVEKPEELEALAKLGCHEVQGYLLGKPMPADQAADLASRHASLMPSATITRLAG
jgi:diguanylate cyclase (GGDEF)-like protein/PAS domain S-box-containing protein